MEILLQRICRNKWLTVILIFLVSCSTSEDVNISYSWSPVKINSEVKEAEQIDSIITPYRIKLDSIMSEVIGYAAHDLTVKGQYESTLGTFVTNLMLTQSISSFDRKVDVAMMNHKGGLRASINNGPITLGEIFEVMPFENEVVLLEIPGHLLLEVIQFIYETKNTMIWPVSFYITGSGIENVLVAGKEIVPDQNYTLAISDYQANGGEGFYMLKPLKRLEVNPVKLRDMIAQEIRQQAAMGDSIKAEVANLITVSDQ